MTSNYFMSVVRSEDMTIDWMSAVGAEDVTGCLLATLHPFRFVLGLKTSFHSYRTYNVEDREQIYIQGSILNEIMITNVPVWLQRSS